MRPANGRDRDMSARIGGRRPSNMFAVQDNEGRAAGPRWVVTDKDETEEYRPVSRHVAKDWMAETHIGPIIEMMHYAAVATEPSPVAQRLLLL